MNKTVIILIVLIILIIISAAICLIVKKYLDNNIINKSGTANGNDGRTYVSENALEFAELLGKNAVESGIDERYIQSERGTLKIVFTGKMFDAEAHGSVYFSGINGGEDFVQRIETAYIFSNELTYDDCKANLAALYGEARDEFEEPFVEDKGGAVTKCCFDGEGFTAELSHASEQEHITLIIRQTKKD